MSKSIKNQSLDLTDAYISIVAPKLAEDNETMRILVGGKKRAKDNRTTAWVHGEIEVPRHQVRNLAYELWQIIAAEQARVDRMRDAMKQS